MFTVLIKVRTLGRLTVYDNGDFSTNSLSEIFCDSNGRLYVVNNLGVYELINEVWQEIIKFKNVIGDEFFFCNNYNKLIITRQNDFLRIAIDFGFLKYKNDTCFELFKTDNSDLYDNFTTRIYTDSENRIWVSNDSGIQLIDGDNWEYYANNYNLSVAGNYIISNKNVTPHVEIYHNGSWQGLFEEYYFRIYSYVDVVTDNYGNLWFSDYTKLYKPKKEVLP